MRSGGGTKHYLYAGNKDSIELPTGFRVFKKWPVFIDKPVYVFRVKLYEEILNINVYIVF